MDKTIIDDSCLEQEDHHKNLSGYYEINEDDCYEFGGYKSKQKKSFFQEVKEALPFLFLIVIFCSSVFWYAFHCVH